ncbi:MAG: TetR family transcriptional regulator [Oscillospiraceae bacterium]|jgi:AcrR family transcriptional regulator|nr:TetR family transcriptional regulator [Oscillospiraceae bacterium]
MFDYLTVEEIAKRWDISDKYVQRLCRNEKIPDAVKRGGIWFIPSATPCPIRSNTSHLMFRGTKKKLFEEAVELFSTHSYDTVKVKDITDQVGITQSAFYNHFKSKQEILDAIYDFFAHYYTVDRPTVDELEPILRNGTLQEIFDCVYYDFRPEYRELMLTCTKIIFQRAFIDDHAKEIFQLIFWDSSLQYVSHVFERAVEIGRFAPMDIQEMAMYRVMLRCFAFMIWLIDADTSHITMLDRYQKRLGEYLMHNITDLNAPVSIDAH